jgi:hypothetical protein
MPTIPAAQTPRTPVAPAWIWWRPPTRRTELRGVYRQLPETFDRSDIHALLGYETDRGALYRILADLSRQGIVLIEKVSLGRRPATYRKLVANLPPAG